MDIIKVDCKKTRLISDGGCTPFEIDNSYSSFLSACNRMYQGVKCDVRFTKDHICVTSRYRDLSKLINKKIHISLTNFDDLKKFCLFSENNNICTLSVFLKLCKKYHKNAYIKLHPPIGINEITQIYTIIEEEQMINNTTIISKDLKYLKLFREKSLYLNLEHQIPKFTDQFFYDAIKYHINLTFPFKEISQELIEICHEHRLKVGCDTINNPIDLLEICEFELDYAYTSSLEEYFQN